MNIFKNMNFEQAEAALNKMLALPALPEARKEQLKQWFNEAHPLEDGSVKQEPETANKYELTEGEIKQIKELKITLKDLTGVECELLGCYLWTVSGNTAKHHLTLKKFGFCYAPKKQKWFFRFERHKINKRFKRGEIGFEEIESKYNKVNI